MIQGRDIIARGDMIRCALCAEAPCDAGCAAGVRPGERLRRIWFGNEQAAALTLPEENACLTCRAKCEEACVRPGEVPIRETMNRLYYQVRPECETELPEDEERLRCDLCGIPMENPFLLSSSVVASTYDMCARAFEAGWAGVCFKTICSLDIREASPRFSAIKGSDGGIIGFKNIEQLSDHSVAENMEIFRRLKEKYPDVPVVIGKNDEDILRTPAANLSLMFGDEPISIKADVLVSDNEELSLLGTTVKCIEVPGHTKGGMCYYFEENKMIFDGDTLFCGSIGRSDFPTGDGEALLKGISDRIFSLPDETVVYPGHNMRTTVGREKQENMFF